jgi:hypothetical protein
MNGLVFALAADADGHVYAAGRFSTAGGVPASRIAMWDGATWSALGSGITGFELDSVDALALDDNGVLYAGGDFSVAGGTAASGIAMWDGTTWSALDSGMDGRVRALAVDGSGILYAAGSFSSAGGVAAANIAAWDGTNWSALGPGIGGSAVLAVTADEAGYVYVGGDFSTAGGGPAINLAVWDGASWSALGSGTNFAVSALAMGRNGNLHVGGGFGSAGAKASRCFGIWHAPTPSAAPIGGLPRAAVTLADAAPNPFNPGTVLRFELLQSAHVRLAIYDLRGRLVRALVDEALSAGAHEAAWDGRDGRGAGVASGTYLARVGAGGQQATTRLTLIK